MDKNTTVATTTETTFNVISRLSTENIGTDKKPKTAIAYKNTFAVGNGEKSFTLTAYGTTAKMLNRLDVSAQLDSQVGLWKCVALNYLDENGITTIDSNIKSIGQLADLYGIKTETAKSYAKIGKYFLNYDEKTDSLSYKCPIIEGASVSNLLQSLSLIDTEADEPLHIIIDNADSFHFRGTQSNLKKEIHDYKTSIDKDNKDVNNGRKNGKKGKADDTNITTAQALGCLNISIANIKDTEVQTKCMECIAYIENALNTVSE